LGAIVAGSSTSTSSSVTVDSDESVEVSSSGAAAVAVLPTIRPDEAIAGPGNGFLPTGLTPPTTLPEEATTRPDEAICGSAGAVTCTPGRFIPGTRRPEAARSERGSGTAAAAAAAALLLPVVVEVVVVAAPGALPDPVTLTRPEPGLETNDDATGVDAAEADAAEVAAEEVAAVVDADSGPGKSSFIGSSGGLSVITGGAPSTALFSEPIVYDTCEA